LPVNFPSFFWSPITMVRHDDSKSKLSKKPKRVNRRKLQTPFYEALEKRELLAADLMAEFSDAMSLDALKRTAQVGIRNGEFSGLEQSGTKVKATHHYLAEGQEHGLVVLSDRIAISRPMPLLNEVQAAELKKLGLTESRPLAGSNFRVYTSASPIDQALVDTVLSSNVASQVVPVFGSVEGKNEIALLDEVIIRLPASTNVENFFADEKFSGYRRLAGTSDQYVATLREALGPQALDKINELSSDSRITWAAPNFHQVWEKFYTPNDPRFTNQWGHNNTGQTAPGAGAPAGLPDADSNLPEAWNFAPQGGSSTIIVGTLDDGIDLTHPDLNIYVGDLSGATDDNGNGWVGDQNGWDFIANDASVGYVAADGNEHGNATAGIAAARGDNALGIAGVSYNSRSLAAQMFDGAAVATDAGIASAMKYLAGYRFDGTLGWDAADVVSHSWGGGAVSVAINTALADTTTAGVPTFFSSGNGGGAIGYPASQSLSNPGISVIGASTNTGQGSVYHAFGLGLDFLTPSNNFDPDNYLAIDTTDRVGAEGYNDGTDVNWPDPDYTGTGPDGFGGTSASAPFAAGIAALARARANALSVPLTGADYRALMRNNTKLLEAAAVGGYSPLTGFNTLNGYGLADASTLMDGIGRAKISVVTATAELANSSTTNLGTLYITQQADFRIRIRNQGTSQLNLNSISISGADYSISETAGDTALALGESTSFVVRVVPSVGGLRTATVTIASNDPSLPSMTLNLEVNAIAPQAAGYVFEDYNGNGVRNSFDKPIAGQLVYADQNANNTFDTNLGSGTFTDAPGMPIADNSLQSDTQVVAGLTDFVTDLNVTVNITHTWDGDMALVLIAPNGDTSVLFNQRGGSGDNLTATVFDDEAATAISAGVAPFTGSFRPETTLSVFDGMPAAVANGTWQIDVFDFFTGDTGTLVDWTLSFSTGEASTLSDSQGFYAFNDMTNGAYAAQTVAPSGWSASTALSQPFSVPGSTTGLNFGFGKNNRFYGNVFNDLDADGVVDGGENGIAGRTVYFDGNNNAVLDTAPVDFNFPGTPGTILPDNTTVDVPITVSGVAGLIADVDFTVDLTHTWDADMELRLISPDGKVSFLFDNRGGSGDNLTNTVWDDEASTAISAGAAPFTGSFRPETPLTVFDGLAPSVTNGTWTFRMTDQAAGDTGLLQSFNLKISTLPDLAKTTDANGWVTFDLDPGVNNMRLIGIPGWVFTVPATGHIAANAAGAPLFNQTFGTTQIAVASRNVFYKGATGTAAPGLPTNKVVAKEGPTAQTLSYANLSNYTRGLNGLVFDYVGLPSGALTASDFEFQWSPQGLFDATLPANQPSAWAAAPAPTAISNTLLSGITRRIQLEWADGAIQDRWLRVTVKATANTGLSQADRYYFGHKNGEVNGAVVNVTAAQPFGRFLVNNLGDVSLVTAALNQTGLSSDSAVDVNKNGTVTNLSDRGPVRTFNNTSLTVIQTPVYAPAPSFGGGLYNGGRDTGRGNKSGGSRNGSDDFFAGYNPALVGSVIDFGAGLDAFGVKRGQKARV
jgi:subtilisin-like proprotein convertase family protein